MGSFEKDIDQQVFKDEVQKAVLNIMYTNNWIRDQFNPIFKKHGILQQHYNVLRIVRGRKGKSVSPGEIIKVMLDKGRDLTRLVDKLVKIEYLDRRTNQTNRRKVEIYITDLGLEVTQIIENEIDIWFKNNIYLPETKAKQINELLDLLRVNGR